MSLVMIRALSLNTTENFIMYLVLNENTLDNTMNLMKSDEY